MSRVLGVGIVGVGTVFPLHYQGCQALPSLARVVAVADVDPRNLAVATEHYFVPFACDDFHELLARDDVDVVHVCTPPRLHEEIIAAALDAGKYVVCEKPLAHTLEATDRIIEIARHYPGKLSTVFQLRYLPEIQRMIWLRDRNMLGELCSGRFIRNDRLCDSPFVASGRWGRWELTGGGVVMTQFIHMLDLMCYLYGKPVQVTADMTTTLEDIEAEDVFAGAILFENGALLSCNSTGSAQKFQHLIHVCGTKAAAHFPWKLETDDSRQTSKLDNQLRQLFPLVCWPSRTLAARATRRILRKLRLYQPPLRDTDHSRMFRQVYSAIHAGEPLPVPPEEARLAVELCTAIYASAITGQRISLPLDSSSQFYGGVASEDYEPLRATARHGVSTT